MNLLMRLIDPEGEPLGPFESVWIPFKDGKATKVWKVTGHRSRFSLALDVLRGKELQPFTLGKPILHASKTGTWDGIVEVRWPNRELAGRVGARYPTVKYLLFGDSIYISECDFRMGPFYSDTGLRIDPLPVPE
jgi:hypothetical protein